MKAITIIIWLEAMAGIWFAISYLIRLGQEQGFPQYRRHRGTLNKAG